MVYDDRVRGEKLMEVKPEQPKREEVEKPKSKQTDGEEIDIDAI